MSLKPLLFFSAGLLPLAGCAGHHRHHEEPPPAVTVEPAPTGYVYYSDPGYYNGYYDHDYWYWHDREGRAHREMRDEHERHLREHPTYDERGYGREQGGYGREQGGYDRERR